MNISFLATLAFVAVFAGVVLIHEFGHFLAARLFKVEVEEFGIGLPPRILTLFHWKGTAFTLNWLPLGGFVRPKGENDPKLPGGLASANPWARLVFLLAGVTMNLIAGVLVYSLLFTQIGLPDYNQVMLYDIVPGSPADQVGLKAEDVVLTAGGEQIASEDQLRAIIHAHLGQPLSLTVRRGDQTLKLTASPLGSRTAEQGALGILPGPLFVPAKSWFATLPYSVLTTYNQVYRILSLPAQLLRGTVSAEQGRFIGLKGIYDFFQQAFSRDVESRASTPTTSEPQKPTNFTLELIATLTVTLGVFNLLPFPALDGARVLFVLPEILMRRRISPEFENLVHGLGFALLLVLMLYINIMDFVNPAQIVLP